MAKLDIQAGSTSVSVAVFIQDGTATDGSGLTGLTNASSGLSCYAVVPGAAAASVTLATLSTPSSAWSSGGFKEIDATHMPGWYRLDLPNAVLASGRSVGVHLQGAAGMAPCPLEIALTGWDNQMNLESSLAGIVTTVGVAAAGLTTATDSISAALAALHNLSTTDVRTQVDAALDSAVPDSVPADGSRASIRQSAYMQTQFLLERRVAGTTLTVKKPDGSTTLFTLTLDDATTPTAITRSA